MERKKNMEMTVFHRKLFSFANKHVGITLQCLKYLKFVAFELSFENAIINITSQVHVSRKDNVAK